MRIGIIGCKATKQNYACSVDEMYSKSPAYRAQSEFCKKAYDDYYVVSFITGVKHHTDIIEPYDAPSLGRFGLNMSLKHKIVDKPDPENVEMVNKQLAEMINKGWEIDYHTSQKPYSFIDKELKEEINYIKQPQGHNAVKSRYKQVIDMLDTKSLKECLKSIGRKSEKPKESKRWWYHPNYEPFYGTCTMLFGYYKKKGLKFNNGNLSKIHLGEIKQASGWVIDKSLLDKLHQTDSGQWRIKQ